MITNKARLFSNHEEAVGAVALELLDQTVFPIEIACIASRDASVPSLGTPVAILRIGPWQDLRRSDRPARDHGRRQAPRLPQTHLRKPGRGHVGAGILKSDKPPAAGQRDLVFERTFPAAMSLYASA